VASCVVAKAAELVKTKVSLSYFLSTIEHCSLSKQMTKFSPRPMSKQTVLPSLRV